MTDATVRGRFVWHELMTTDSAAAQAFYSRTLGWQVQPWEDVPSYSMFVAANGPIGGVAATPDGAPHWLPYIAAPDADETVQQAVELGATVLTEPTSIPGGGRYAVLKDPQGARFGVYSSATDPGNPAAPAKGEFSWHELATQDYIAAFDFYAALFGWEKIEEHDMGPMGIYFLFGLGGTALGGIFNQPPEMPGEPSWLGYVRVPDVQQAAKKVIGAGGRVINGPMEVPGGDWIVQCLDPQGAAFAAHVLQADMKPTARKQKARPTQPAATEEPVQAAAARAAPARKKSVKKKATKAAKAAGAKTKAAAKKKVAAKKAPAKKKAAGKKKAKAAGKTPRKAARRPAKKKVAAPKRKRPVSRTAKAKKKAAPTARSKAPRRDGRKAARKQK